MIPRYLDGSEVPPHMRNLKFVPWPLPDLPSLDLTKRLHDVNDPSTWGRGSGFVSNERFRSNATEQVIPRTNRAVTRKW